MEVFGAAITSSLTRRLRDFLSTVAYSLRHQRKESQCQIPSQNVPFLQIFVKMFHSLYYLEAMVSHILSLGSPLFAYIQVFFKIQDAGLTKIKHFRQQGVPHAKEIFCESLLTRVSLDQ